MKRWERINPDDHPDPDELDSIDEILDALQKLLSGPIVQSFALSRDERGLSRSWLGQTFKRAKRLRGDREFVNIGIWSRERRLVATLNQLEVENVGEVLEAEDPYVEAETIYRGLLTLAEQNLDEDYRE